MEQIYRLIVYRPKSVLLVLILLTGFFAYHARHIHYDTSVESLLPEDDPENQYYQEVRKLFGGDDLGVIGLITDNIYTPEILQKLQRLTQEVEKVDGVANVLSLANAPDPVALITGEGPDILLPHLPATVAAAADIRKKVEEYPVYLKNVVAPDGRAAAINIFFAEMTNDEFMRRGIDEAVQAIVDRENAAALMQNRSERLYYTGLPHFKVYSAAAMSRDIMRFVPLMLLFIAVVLFLSFRSLRGVLLPTLTVIVSLLWTLGIMVLTGANLSFGSMALPPLVLVIGVAYSLHVVAEYYELARPGRAVDEVVLETLRAINTPALLAALTTVLGFFSQVVNNIVSIREMGIYSSVGIALGFVFSVVLVPALLALLPLPTRREGTFAPGLTQLLRRLVAFVIARRRSVIIACLGLALLAAWFIPSIQVDADFQSFFRASDPIRQATDMVSRHLAGSMAFNVVVDGKERDIMKQVEILRRLKNFQAAIDTLPGVDKTLSFVDYCEAGVRGAQLSEEVGTVSPEGTPGQNEAPGAKTGLWDDPSQLRGVLQLISQRPESLSGWITKDFSRTNILVRISLSRSSAIAVTADKIEALAEELLPPELSAHPTGNIILLTKTTGDIVSGQVQSLVLTTGVIFLLMSAIFLSARVGVLAMLPNLFPIVIFFGLMGATGVVLNFGTNIIASIALGLAVNDTIHIMYRLSSEVRSTEKEQEALVEALSSVGKPALYYSFLLFLGFLTLGFSTFVPIQEFGLLSAMTTLIGVAGELLLLPALLATIRIITLWDLLYVKLGKDPHRTIPMFEGLRPMQARIVTLMGKFKSFPAGQPIVQRGDVGNEMYVLINGSADVFIHAADQRRKVRTLRRGEVFGEMGLLRHNERTADVVANEGVEVMAVNEQFLDRMQRRYPRIGAKIFLNIAKIISDRLQDSQQR